MDCEQGRNGWRVLGTLEVAGRVCVSDTSYFYDEPAIIPMDAGGYVVTLLFEFLAGREAVRSLRTVADGMDDISRGDQIGTVVVDFAQVGVCDRDAVETAFQLLGDEAMSSYYDQLDRTDPAHWVHLPGLVRMAVVRPVFGDGTFPIYSLANSLGRRVGIEVDFAGPAS